MRIRKSFWQIVYAVGFLAMSAPAWADTLESINITGKIYRESGSFDNTPTSSAGLTYEGSFTASNINFNTGPAGNPGVFLAFGGPTGNFQNGTGADQVSTSVLNSSMSDDGFFGFFSYSTVIEIKGTFTFLGGTPYKMTHDDGVVLKVDGSIISPFDLPAPTPAETSSWTPASTITNGSVDLWYMATAGNPEVLRFTDPPPPAVPEPTSIVLLAGVIGFVGVARRKKMTA
jgi:hypothetical protein